MYFLWSPFPAKQSTKSPRIIRGKFGGEFGRKSRTKIRKIRELSFCKVSDLIKGGDLSPEKRQSRVTQDDGTVTLCALCAATVLSRNCCTGFGCPLTKKVMSHSRDGPGATANTVPLTAVWNTHSFRYPPPPNKSPKPGHLKMALSQRTVPSRRRLPCLDSALPVDLPWKEQ